MKVSTARFKERFLVWSSQASPREVFRESDKTGSIGVYKGCVGLGQPYLIQTISADICVCQVNRRATKYLFGNELTARKIHSYHSAICIFEAR